MFYSNLKKCTCPVNEFLVDKRRNNRIIKDRFFLNLKKLSCPAKAFLLHRYINNKNHTNPVKELQVT